jgi:hypothetical protein
MQTLQGIIGETHLDGKIKIKNNTLIAISPIA